MYFKNLKKKKKQLFGALQITSTHTHILSFFLLSFLSLVNSHQENTLTLLSSVPENNFWNLSLPTRYVSLFYTHDVYIYV